VKGSYKQEWNTAVLPFFLEEISAWMSHAVSGKLVTIHITIQCQWVKYETLFALLQFLGLATYKNPVHAFHENGFVIPSDPPPMEPMPGFGTGVLSVETYQHISCKDPPST